MPGQRLANRAALTLSAGNLVRLTFSQMTDVKQFKEFIDFLFIDCGKRGVVIRLRCGKRL